MPIHVDIRINDEHIKTIHIGRDDAYMGSDEIHSYIVTDRTVTTRSDWYDIDAKRFKHKYSDGLDVCVQKALEAYNG